MLTELFPRHCLLNKIFHPQFDGDRLSGIEKRLRDVPFGVGILQALSPKKIPADTAKPHEGNVLTSIYGQ